MENRDSTRELVRLSYDALNEKKATDITVIDITGLSVVADYFIIASADNVRQAEALCDNVEEVLGRAGYQCRQIEGKASGNWILMDYNDVIIHIFDKTVLRYRAYMEGWTQDRQHRRALI